ncbi:MAG: saccharopine dehydrogenase C-terminal domain-containing protein [Myxococcota bacterium]|nr:saccharopine dehydrogenase C-terminal domain-containing protein [Myxococcota bacterium]
MKVIVLGAGLVGGPLALDLDRDEDFEVTVADISAQALQRLKHAAPSLKVIQADLSNAEILKELLKQYHWVVNAVPGFMGFKTMRSILESKKDVVDIAFYSEDPFELDGLAKEQGVTAIVDCGVAPGMNNLLTGHMAEQLDEIDTAITYVGGLPKVRTWPYEYKAVFSPIDVIEEYTRPARYIQDGKMVVMPALSEPELLDFPGVGTLEAFNSDGLRTLAKTIPAKLMKEKTLRYIGHREKMSMMRESGFFGEEEIEINGRKIRPIDLTSKLLFAQWKLAEGEEDITVLKVFTEGTKDGKRIRHSYDLLDSYCTETNTTSMARATGYTASMAVRLLAQGLFADKGINPPEFIGKNKECVDFMLKGLKERGVIYRETIESLES